MRVLRVRKPAALLAALALFACPPPAGARGRPKPHAVPPFQGRAEDDPRLGGEAHAFARARVRLLSPPDQAQLLGSDGGIRVSFVVERYAIGPAPDAPEGSAHPHAHLLVDGDATLTLDGPGAVLLRGLAPGPHLLRLVLCRPWHEVVKAKEAFALSRVWVGPRPAGKAAAAAEQSAWPDPRKPILTLVLPLPEPRESGPVLVPLDQPADTALAVDSPVLPPGALPTRGPRPAKAEPARDPSGPRRPIVDFYLANARLVPRSYRVRLVADRKEYPTVRAWKPVKLDPMRPGAHHVSIDLLDKRGTKVRNAVNRNDRAFTLR